MQLGMIGLGKMGANMTTRLLAGGHTMVVHDRNADAMQQAEKAGATSASDLNNLVQQLAQPRVVWVMVPSGDPTEAVIQQLAKLLSAGDTILDGGNSNYKESVRRGEQLQAAGIHFVDVGTSGGVWGLKEG